MESYSGKIAEKVLVVDDDEMTCDLLAHILRNEGHDPVTATDSHEALAAVAEHDFRLSLVDINLPGMSGLELATELKSRVPRLEVVIITGHGTFDNAVKAIKIGAYDYLKKPISIDDLTMCLRRFHEREAFRERIRNAEQRYARLVSNLPVMVFVIRDDLGVEFVNETSETMLGFAPREALETPRWFLEVLHPDDREHMRDMVVRSFRSEIQEFSLECRLLHKSGHSIHAIVRMIPRSDRTQLYGACAGGKVDRLEGIVMDISDRVVLEKTLLQKEKLNTLGAISAEVAHEIRNPLTAIGGFARRLQKKMPHLAEPEIIVREASRLERMLSRIRDYLRPVEIAMDPCDVNGIMRGSLDLLAPELKRKRMRLQLLLEEGLPAVWADSDVLEQVCINLVRNAVQASGDGQSIQVRTYRSGNNLHLEFANKMNNYKELRSDQLFTPFEQGGQSFGLPLCHRLIKQMGGLLALEQDRKRVVFTVSLPVPEAGSGLPCADQADSHNTPGSLPEPGPGGSLLCESATPTYPLN